MVNEEVVKFMYPEVVMDQYIHRGVVYNHNDFSYDGGTKHQIGF